MRNRMRQESGQIALILVLIMTVIAAIAVTLAARSTVETRVQEIKQDSTQAMLAAESGLEAALRTAPDANLTGTLDGGSASYSVTHANVTTNYTVYEKISAGSIVEINLAGMSAGPMEVLKIYWKAEGAGSRNIMVTKVASGSVSDQGFTNGVSARGFVTGTGSGGTVGSVDFSIDTNNAVNFDPGTTQAIRIMVLGGSTTLAFVPQGGVSLPSQLIEKKVVGTVTRGTEKTNYGIDYKQSKNKILPEIFDYAVFSGGSISQ